MHVNVRLFARLKDIAGTGELARQAPPGATARTVWDTLVNEFAQLRDYEASISVAVNEEYSRMDVAIADGDEIAFLPPVSGG
ncbi:MAG TPA: molybdopterin converting factor subunit 1 [Acidobacteria bacterium]|nr:molybdopterin converting factor subunit 1 [Acidobacteriota bacterium]